MPMYQGSFTTGESIWLWWMPYTGSLASFEYITIGNNGEHIFIVNYIAPGSGLLMAPTGPDLCNDLLFGQIRLYEKDYSI